jgi:ppGpp synthetase/RelA/SpoT-type nucleotidyltranferase
VRPPLTTSQIERLGVRLVQGTKPPEADLELLHEVLGMYSEVLAGAVERVREGLGVSPTSRIKNTGTIMEKLHRYGGHWLKSIQDLAECESWCARTVVVRTPSCSGWWTCSARTLGPPRSSIGERLRYMGTAPCVIAFPEGVPVEIQVRTRWQHEWAELFEKIADRVGRGIRYGDPPALSRIPTELEAMHTVEQSLVSLSHVLRTFAVERALAAADLIDAVETGEATTPEDPRLGTYHQRVDDELLKLRKTLEDL